MGAKDTDEYGYDGHDDSVSRLRGAVATAREGHPDAYMDLDAYQDLLDAAEDHLDMLDAAERSPS